MLAAMFHNTVLVVQCCNLTPVTSVTTFKNWWQLGFHPKFAFDTLSFYSDFCVLYFQRAACSTFSDLHCKFTLTAHHVWKILRLLRLGEEKRKKGEERNHRAKI